MRVLVTNAQEPQAYVIIRSLRPVATRIVITTGGRSVYVDKFDGMAAHSRFVDARYEVPHFADDWHAGRLGNENSPAEEAYIQSLEDICRKEGISVIVPSLDPEVYVLSKNTDRFAGNGVTVATAGREVIERVTDKAETLKAAKRAGFPIPDTHFPSTPADVETIISSTQPPWVIKPRLGAHMAHVTFAETPEALRRAYHELSERQPDPLVQAYIPGVTRCNYYVTIDRNHQIISLLNPTPIHVIANGVYTSIKSVYSQGNTPRLRELQALIRDLQLWGSFTVQTKLDPDGIPRLLEINPRMGHHLWFRTGLGVNEPLICIELAQNRIPDGDFKYPSGVMLLDPFHDLFHFLVRLFGRKPEPGPEQSPETVPELLKLYRHQYLNRAPKVFCPEVSSLFIDPRPCLHAFAFKANSLLIQPLLESLRPRDRE